MSKYTHHTLHTSAAADPPPPLRLFFLSLGAGYGGGMYVCTQYAQRSTMFSNDEGLCAMTRACVDDVDVHKKYV